MRFNEYQTKLDHLVCHGVHPLTTNKMKEGIRNFRKSIEGQKILISEGREGVVLCGVILLGRGITEFGGR